MKYLEQRVEELEKEVKLLKAKNKLNDTSNYLNNYPPYNNSNSPDYMYNPSINLMSVPDLETAFASPWDSSELQKSPLDTITVNLSSIVNNNFINQDYADSSDIPQYYPPHPDIIGSWDDFDWNTSKEWAEFNQSDNIPPYPGHEEISETSSERLNKTEKKIEKDFGKIISKFKILTHEWEMDGYGYIVRDIEYNQNVIITNHGKPIVVHKSYLNDIISGYKERIQETQRALFLIK
jgi:hypothetical protein